MDRITPIIMLRSLNVERGGVTKASLKRANVLAEHFGKSIIITTVFQQNFNEIIGKLYGSNLLSKNVHVINFFDSMRNKHNRKWYIRKPIEQMKEKGYTEFRMTKHQGLSYRYYKDGMYKKYKRFSNNKKIVFVDYRNNCLQRIRREEYTEEGDLIRIRHIEPATNKVRFDQYYDKNQKCFLSIHVNPKNETNGYTVDFSKKPKSYSNVKDLQREWLEKELTRMSRPVIISEQRELDKLLMGVKVPGLKRIAMAHSTHLKAPYNDVNQVDSPYARLFNKLNLFDKLVLLTQDQKKDVEHIYGQSEKIVVIPHAYDPEVKQDIISEKKEAHNKRVVMIARYDKVKRIDEAIGAFSHVVDKVKDAKLEIYGSGPLEQYLKDLINEKGLAGSVSLQGYSTNPKKEYQTACCSILTSEREGFGMVLTESMAEGAPVVAYDIKYGPKDIIQDGINGFIVEKGNQMELAERIIRIIKDSELRERLSVNAKDIRNTFSEKQYRESWIELITNM